MDYTVCNLNTLYHHLHSQFPRGVLSAEYQGVYYEEAKMEEKFRDGLSSFISECNIARTTAEGFELCEDYDVRTGITTFYIMREDGVSMAELSVFFLDEESGIGLHARDKKGV